jgi:hypothetical protein
MGPKFRLWRRNVLGEWIIVSVAVAFAALSPAVGGRNGVGTPEPVLSLATGGPDGFGYQFIDSRIADGPSFLTEWEDLSNSGTPIAFTGNSPWPADDEGQAEVAIGFPFIFYGNSYATTWVNTNGYLRFGSPTAVGNDGNPPYRNVAIPSAHQHNMIAVKWSDRTHVIAWSATRGTALIADSSCIDRFGLTDV